MISTGHGYWTSFYQVRDRHHCICLILRYFQPPGYGSIIVTYFKIKDSLPFLRILKGPMRYTHSLFHIFSASFAGNIPYFLFDRFVRWHVAQNVTSLWTAYFKPFQYKYWQIIASVRSSTG